VTLPFDVLTIFAEDFREEIAGTNSLIGIIPDNIEVPAFPGNLMKLVFYTRAHVPTEVQLSDLSIHVMLIDGTEMLLLEVDRDLLRTSRQTSIDEARPHYGIISHATMSPVPVHSAGQVKVIVRSGSGERISGMLTFKAPADALPDEQASGDHGTK